MVSTPGVPKAPIVHNTACLGFFSLTRRDKGWRVSGVEMTLSQCE